MLLNLCVNARDAMPDGGRITIRASNLMVDEHYAAMNIDARVGPYLQIEVEDTGVGMPSDVVDKIFDPFFTTKDLGKGTGLGLSTSLAIVKSHGGFIRVYSEPGRGSIFRIYLPAVADESLAAEAAVAEATLPRGRGETILVVDDEAAVRQITKQTLEAFGYRVLLAADGSEAVSTYVQHRRRSRWSDRHDDAGDGRAGDHPRAAPPQPAGPRHRRQRHPGRWRRGAAVSTESSTSCRSLHRRRPAHGGADSHAPAVS